MQGRARACQGLGCLLPLGVRNAQPEGTWKEVEALPAPHIPTQPSSWEVFLRAAVQRL